MIILGIETSCDETSLAVLNSKRRRLKLESFLVSSQTKLHARWGGVVPELAARRHAETIIPLLQETLQRAKVKPQDLDLIAVTAGPGLITALQVGVETAKALAATWRLLVVPVNHIAGHLVSPFLTPANWKLVWQRQTWPAVALVVSGGHTELYLMRSLAKWQLLGKTLDDAAGEAFDKVAKMLGLPYPGGPRVAKLAASGNPAAYDFPRPMLKTADSNFSFAGLKTAVRYSLPMRPSAQRKNDICASFQQAAIDVLVNKTLRAVAKHNAHTVIVGGGVSANQALRDAFAKALPSLERKSRLLFPEFRFTGDNAAMIALAAAVQTNFRIPPVKRNQLALQANANWELWN